MLKRSITYTNFNDETVTEDFYFNLSKAELVEMELSTTGGLGETLKRIVQTRDHQGLIKEFKSIIMLAYGKRTGDGRFVKNQEVLDEFIETGAYSALFMDLVTNVENAALLIRGLIPADLVEQVEQTTVTPTTPATLPPPPPTTIPSRDPATGAPLPISGIDPTTGAPIQQG